jgi:hypothetical protein
MELDPFLPSLRPRTPYSPPIASILLVRRYKPNPVPPDNRLAVEKIEEHLSFFFCHSNAFIFYFNKPCLSSLSSSFSL